MCLCLCVCVCVSLSLCMCLCVSACVSKGPGDRGMCLCAYIMCVSNKIIMVGNLGGAVVENNLYTLPQVSILLITDNV